MGSPSEEFGPYRVYEQIGLGGMATVHRAETKGIAGFSRQVALKRMLPGIAADERLVQSFIREARLASHLRHANVAQTYDLGKVGDTYFIAMELVPGRNLREILEHCATTAGHMPLAIAMNIVNQIADALDYAHNLCDESGRPLGIIHRDVSPANVIVSEGGVVKLIDFGIAKASKASGMQTLSGTIKGKFGYMAPESLRGQVDARADLFALGVIAHELLANRPLFQGNDDMDTLNRVREMPIVPPSQLNAKVPPEIDAIVMTALERDPDKRWQRATALREALTTETKHLGLVVRDTEVIAWIDDAFSPPAASLRPDPFGAAVASRRPGARPSSGNPKGFERAPNEQSEPSIVITAGSQYDRPVESWNDMETREVKQMPMLAQRMTSAHVVPRKDRGSSPPQTQSARGSSPRHPAGSPAIARGSSPRHDATARPAASAHDSSPRHDATARPAASARDSSPHHEAIPRTTSSARDSSPRHDATARPAASAHDSSPRHDASRPTSSARDSSPRHDATARPAASTHDSSPRHDASRPTSSARDSSPRHDATSRPAASARDSSPHHEAIPRTTSSARDSSPRHDAVPRATSSARDSSPRHPTSTTPTSPVRTIGAHGADLVPTRDSALTLQTPLARERLPTLNRPPTPDPEPRDSAPTIDAALAHERAETVEERNGQRLRTLAAADERATRSGVPRLPLVAEPSHAAIAVRATDVRAERAIEAALDELDEDATHARIVAPRNTDEDLHAGGAGNFLLPILVLIAAGGAAAVVYFALPHLT